VSIKGARYSQETVKLQHIYSRTHTASLSKDLSLSLGKWRPKTVPRICGQSSAHSTRTLVSLEHRPCLSVCLSGFVCVVVSVGSCQVRFVCPLKSSVFFVVLCRVLVFLVSMTDRPTEPILPSLSVSPPFSESHQLIRLFSPPRAPPGLPLHRSRPTRNRCQIDSERRREEVKERDAQCAE